MKIVEASTEHIFIIQSLSDRIWPQTFGNILTQDQIAYMMDMMYSKPALEKQMENGHHYLLVEEDGEYLGYLSYELNYKKSDITKIHKIYILPSLQGKGIGHFRDFYQNMTSLADKWNYYNNRPAKFFHVLLLSPAVWNWYQSCRMFWRHSGF